MDDYRVCYICGANGNGDPLEKHHVFGGPNRKLSEKFGAYVYLCGNKCHRNGKESVHRCRAVADAIKAEIQERVMEEQGWDVDYFRAVFGKSYV